MSSTNSNQDIRLQTEDRIRYSVRWESCNLIQRWSPI